MHVPLNVKWEGHCEKSKITYADKIKLLPKNPQSIASTYSTSVEQKHSWNIKSSSAIRILRILWKLTVHCHVQKIPPLVPILSQMNPVYAHASFSFKVNFNTIFLPGTFEHLSTHLCVGWKISLSHCSFPIRIFYENRPCLKSQLSLSSVNDG
jgi:hypothetical protein